MLRTPQIKYEQIRNRIQCEHHKDSNICQISLDRKQKPFSKRLKKEILVYRYGNCLSHF